MVYGPCSLGVVFISAGPGTAGMSTENRPAADVNVAHDVAPVFAVLAGGAIFAVVRRVVLRVRLRGRLRVVLGVVLLTLVRVVLVGALVWSCAPREKLKPNVISETAKNLFIHALKSARRFKAYTDWVLWQSTNFCQRPQIIARVTQI